MIYKLARNARKGRWDDLTVPEALDLLYLEYAELVQASIQGNMVEVLLEAADTANFALIISAIAMENGVVKEAARGAVGSLEEGKG